MKQYIQVPYVILHLIKYRSLCFALIGTLSYRSCILVEDVSNKQGFNSTVGRGYLFIYFARCDILTSSSEMLFYIKGLYLVRALFRLRGCGPCTGAWSGIVTSCKRCVNMCHCYEINSSLNSVFVKLAGDVPEKRRFYL